MNKHFLYVVGVPALFVAVVVAAGVYRMQQKDAELLVGADAPLVSEAEDASKLAEPIESNSEAPAEMAHEAETFTGTLSKVDTGCFADGECYVEVDGRHITVLVGRSRETVGAVLGVESFGDLEKHIGDQVHVYAQALGEGAYTLYGNAAFYIQLGISSEPLSPGNTTGNVQGVAVGEPNPATPAPKTAGGCMVGGCSNQLCVEEGTEGMSTCEWSESYACYQTATCERQASGQCGWTETSLLSQCLVNAQKAPEMQAQ